MVANQNIRRRIDPLPGAGVEDRVVVARHELHIRGHHAVAPKCHARRFMHDEARPCVQRGAVADQQMAPPSTENKSVGQAAAGANLDRTRRAKLDHHAETGQRLGSNRDPVVVAGKQDFQFAMGFKPRVQIDLVVLALVGNLHRHLKSVPGNRSLALGHLRQQIDDRLGGHGTGIGEPIRIVLVQ